MNKSNNLTAVLNDRAHDFDGLTNSDHNSFSLSQKSDEKSCDSQEAIENWRRKRE